MQGRDYSEIRAAVRKLCGDFPPEYWRSLDRERDYPTEFVAALTRAGYLAVLIPEQYGGAGLPISVALLLATSLGSLLSPAAANCAASNTISRRCARMWTVLH